MEERPKIGVGVIIIKENKILLGKRKNAHGPGTWCPPGGHLEFGEAIEECALREVAEETGIKVKNLKRGAFTNDIFSQEKKHYITIHMIADYEFGDPQILEPEKCEIWQWFDFENLPSPMFLPMENLLKEYGSLKNLLNCLSNSNWQNQGQQQNIPQQL